ncbi:MAG: hypothetical protein O9256_01740 [Rhizobiaceae bacterium]|nr:hypothetical protein [Rhizobiaceae bacterium]
MPDDQSPKLQKDFDWKLLELLSPSKHLDPNFSAGCEWDQLPPEEVPLSQDDVLEGIERGEISPEEAEGFARRLGWEPFATPRKYFLTKAPGMEIWTPEMLLSWIKERTWQAVHRHYEPSYRDTYVWEKTKNVYSLTEKKQYFPYEIRPKGNYRDVYKLTALQETRYGRPYTDFDGEERHFVKLQDIMPELRSHLGNGIISALGIPEKLHSPNLQIAPDQWLMGVFSIHPDRGGVLKGLGFCFTDVKFKFDGILAVYPPNRNDPEVLEITSIDSWIKEIPPLDQKKALIVRCLQNAFPAGMPRVDKGKVRYPLIKRVLGDEITHQWFGGMDAQNPVDVEKRYERFRKAIERLLDQTLVGYKDSKRR